MKKILTIVGARPQFIKAAVLSCIIAKKSDFEEIILHTGQHFDTNMSAVFFEEMQLKKPTYHFEIHSLPRKEMIAKMLREIDVVIAQEKPDAVLVYGDTNSTLAGALAAEKNGVKLIHIEAGLRSFNLEMPEEINRIKTDALSDLLICPSQTAVANLSKENNTKTHAKIVNCGDIMKDAVAFYSALSEEKSTILTDLQLEKNNFILATIHRQENTDTIEKLKNILEALETVHAETKVVIPLHPRTQKILEAQQLNYNLTFIQPIGYLDMLVLLKNCTLVVTDSGGLQKEAFFNKKFAIIVREQTEWIELVAQNYATIVGSNKEKIISEIQKNNKRKISFATDLYGTKVGGKMYQEIKNFMD